MRRANTYYYHNDHLATPQKMTNSSGTVVWAADYKPFGEATITISTITNNLRFPGQYYDAETGLHYNDFRDYYPTIGSYIQADPIGLNGGLNLFAYAGNDPVNLMDPSGLQMVAGNPAMPVPICIPNSCRATPEQQQQAIDNLKAWFNFWPLYNYLRGGGIGSWLYDVTHPEVPSSYFSKVGNKQRNWATEQAKSEAQQSGKSPCDILTKMMKRAKCAGDTQSAQDIKSAQKWLGCRHHSKD